jgi:hypothetical protein
MSLNLSWRQRLFVLGMLSAVAAVFLLSQPGASSSVRLAQAPSYASEYTAPANPFQDIRAVRLHQARRLADPLAQAHRVRHHTHPAVDPAPAVPPPAAAAPSSGAAPISAVQAYAESLVGKAQFGCLDLLWNNESGWNYQAQNPSGAYGIPQALPGFKMAVAGADWATNPYTQVKWGVLDYIDPVYGSACNAWGHEEATGWY